LFGLIARGALQTEGLPFERKGASVARKRPTASDAVPPQHLAPEHAEPGGWGALTRAEAHALRRSTPLTPEQFKARGRLVEQGIGPLRRV
jgi:hypothetical protein